MSKIKKTIRKWLDIEWVSTRMPAGDFVGTKHLEALGNQVSEGIKAGLEPVNLTAPQHSESVSIPINVFDKFENQTPYKVAAILKEPDMIETISGEVTIPIEKLCQSLTDGTKGVKIGDYLIPTSEIRFFRLMKDDE